MEILGEAIELDASEREAWLAAVCAGDDELRGEVARLLSHQKAAANFMEESPLGGLARRSREDESIVGRRVGPYLVVEEIGRGGMGAVYLARRADDQYESLVAVKVIKRGMDTDAVVRRFRNERQILATLGHPNIARLLDGGTTEDGRPYFVMEYVEGRPLTEYCDAKKLSVEGRLRLFLKVCSAVSYAHRNLVVHRDIKPGNILVSEEGEPKLLDFGIARLLDDADAEGNATATLLRAMTPEYASPEQVRGEPVTTATDVYSLGVLLYELLTGELPYRLKRRTADEITRAIREQEPTKPSTRVAQSVPRAEESGEASESGVQARAATRNPKLLRGDLDNIALMALRKEPQLRYASVEQFAEDIDLHLEGLPVRARRGTFIYRASKFIGRNKAGVAAAAAVLLTLIGGVIVSAWEAHAARVERAIAEERFNEVREMAHAVMFDYHDAIAALPGSTPVRERMVRDALQYLDRLSRQAGDDLSLQRELAAAYEKIGQIQGNSYYSNLGDSDGALKSYRKSAELREHLLAADPRNRDFQSELSDSYQGVGDVLYDEGDLSAALHSYENALKLRESLVMAEPASAPHRRALAEVYSRIGDVKGMEGYSNLGDVAGALENYSKAEALMEALAAADPENHELQFTLAGVLTAAGMLRDTTGDAAAALATERRAAGILEQLTAAEPNNSGYRLQLLATYAFMRYALVDNDQTAEAIENSRKIIVMLQALVDADPKNTTTRRDLEVAYNALGQDLSNTGSASAALENHRKALAICESLSRADPNSEQYRSDVSVTLQRLGEAQAAGHDYRAAVESYRKALAIREAALKAGSSNERARSDTSSLYADICDALGSVGDTQGALEYCSKAVPLSEELSAGSPANAKLKARLALRYFALGMAHLRLAQSTHGRNDVREQWQEARDAFANSLNVWQDMRSKGTLSGTDAGKPDEAAREVARCDAALR
jgi:non-specific serine/threonine protein kinase/serine/threonine-protein kinase